MRVIPRSMEKQPRIITALLAMLLYFLIGWAHPDEHHWRRAADFLLGFSTALIAVNIFRGRKSRDLS